MFNPYWSSSASEVLLWWVQLRFCGLGIFALLKIYFYFLIFFKCSFKIDEFCSRKIHFGTFYCFGLDLTGTRGILFWDCPEKSGKPGHPSLSVSLCVCPRLGLFVFFCVCILLCLSVSLYICLYACLYLSELKYFDLWGTFSKLCLWLFQQNNRDFLNPLKLLLTYKLSDEQRLNEETTTTKSSSATTTTNDALKAEIPQPILDEVLSNAEDAANKGIEYSVNIIVIIIWLFINPASTFIPLGFLCDVCITFSDLVTKHKLNSVELDTNISSVPNLSSSTYYSLRYIRFIAKKQSLDIPQLDCSEC